MVLAQHLGEPGRVAVLVDAEEHVPLLAWSIHCLLYTSDAADEEDSVDLGGCRIIKKKKIPSKIITLHLKCSQRIIP